MGTVFGASHIYSGEIRKILKICKRPNSLKLYVPNYIEFSKVSGCIGKIHKTTNHSALELQMIAGGAVQMSCEFSNKQKLIRMVEITETATSKYVKLHTIDADIANSVCNYNENIRNMIKLKFFASDFLRNKWKGMRIDWKITESTNKEIKKIMEKTCLASFGDDEQMDVLSLYFILHMYGDMKDISYILQNEGKDMILIMPPFAFCSPKCSFDVLARFEYPLELWNCNGEKFHQMLSKLGVKIPNG
ncbi:hypothetical protein GPJ56_001773 [Histomonas meleagridis]|uniref:uncharacterized protein n=1 Tax=Histomonas meleagridis TaxID=135588 RepID=UPI00355A3917|nr:hypothetical protein GPJ56_001773 [Histomonas meleagridis]KAH0806547.1 hypothetical protein GO595_000709 [Histomonas meleagridis]